MLFPASVYRDRRTRAAASAREQGFSALLIADPANIFYLTGYNAWSFYMPQFLLISAQDARTLLVGRDMDMRVAFRTAELSDDEVLPYPETYIHRADIHPFDWVAEQLIALDWMPLLVSAPVGFESDADHFSVRSFQSLTAGLPGVTFMDDGHLVNWLRVVKSDAEIDLMRRAGAVATNAMLIAGDMLAHGRPQNEVAAALQAAQATGTTMPDGTPADGDYTAIVPLIATGESADAPHLTWTAAPLKQGETVSIEMAGAHHRYHAPCSRTFALGQVSKEVERLADLTVEALTLTVDAIRPGRTSGDVASEYWGFLAKHGLSKESRLGYSIGVGFPPDWGENTVSIRPDDTTILQPNMTFHIIAGMWMDGFGCEFSESVRVAPDGVEMLTDVPRELIRR
ncbi:Xaa-Pro peptidase family protein [Galactobacter sp.]|uniref:M24 family metallopeptidase n=1 Tax=Galactobacter sp. TaxID=2676125 RepID=UPI0025B845F5|nr:Xaa-Pro peptidase family protein [Galactobacter sp.]